MPVPAQCQSIVDEIETLEEQIVDVGDLVGDAKWKVASNNLRLRQEIAREQQKLNACVIAFGGGYDTEVVVLDFTPGGGTITLPLEATLFRVIPGSAVQIEHQTVQSGHLALAHGPTDPGGASLAILVDETPNAIFGGPLGRTNAFATLPLGAPGNPSGTITIVIPGPVAVSAATINASIGAAAIPAIGGFTVTSVAATLGTGTIALAVAGRVLGVLAVTYTYVFTLVPTRNMSAVATSIVDVSASPGTISSATLGGLGGAVFSLAASLVEPALRSAVTPVVSGLVNGAITTAAGSAIGRTLNSFESVSMRRVTITPSGITFFPTITSYGP